MTRKERMLAAVRHRPVDRLPFCTYNFHPYGGASHVQDRAYRELLTLVEVKAGMYIKSGARSVRRPESRHASRTTTQVAELPDRRVVTTILHTSQGDLRSVVVTPKGQPSMEVEHFVKTEEDI